MQVPQSDILTTNCLGKVFSKTVATYKFFWFVSILQIHARTGDLRINVWDIVIRMVANAWYPIHYFRLSFGKSDSLFDIVMELHRITQIPIDANAETIIEALTDRWFNALKTLKTVAYTHCTKKVAISISYLIPLGMPICIATTIY